VRRVLGFIVHNWPLKIAAIGLATLLYAGFVLSRDSLEVQGPIQIIPNLPEDATLLENPPPVNRVRYVAPADVSRLTPDDFRAEIDLRNVTHGQPVQVPVSVRSLVGGVIPTEWSPRAVVVTVDSVVTRDVNVEIVTTVPANVQTGTLTVDPPVVKVRGAQSLVQRVARVTSTVAVEPSSLDIDRTVDVAAVDASGATIAPLDIEPGSVHVRLPVLTNDASKGLPVRPVVTGGPGQGYRVAGIDLQPSIVSVLGDADDLKSLVAADTQPIQLNGDTKTVTREVALALPQNVTAVDVDRVEVTIRIEPVTEARTFTAGVALLNAAGDRVYSLSTPQVLLTLFGSVADLDRLASGPVIAQLDVAGLNPGEHLLPVKPVVPTGVSVADMSPPSVTVTIGVPPPATPSPS
jgi:YbbR domain-containing protein